MKTRHIAALALMLAATTGLTGCGGASSADGGDPKSSKDSSSSGLPEKDATDSASDDGVAKVKDDGFTVQHDSEDSSEVVAAVEVTNTSSTDVLQQADLKLNWSNKDGGSDEGVTEEPLNLLPGESTILGGLKTVSGGTPTKLKPEIAKDSWYPLSDVKAHGWDFRLNVDSSSIDPKADVVEGSVDYSTKASGDDFGGYLFARLVSRDADWELLGVSQNDDPIKPDKAGAHSYDTEFPTSEWPSKADESTSEVVVGWQCCVLAR